MISPVKEKPIGGHFEKNYYKQILTSRQPGPATQLSLPFGSVKSGCRSTGKFSWSEKIASAFTKIKITFSFKAEFSSLMPSDEEDDPGEDDDIDVFVVEDDADASMPLVSLLLLVLLLLERCTT
jgi:hypothetical protein